ncbi:hypothetical protein FAZ95_39060 [Trinickia violacea]|uniref:Uncharacterized protein n=1 Tax=Trinickia violacea TaxID=2571746 RepID=A0A4P8J7K1_9BURK|nr:hypothetical protein [Trinickia violacea]QCP55129.1 hypothetical protein FAZ95_39060 [Trinickia violacea]
MHDVAERDRCRRAFLHAVRCARAGDFEPGNALIRGVAVRHGKSAAAIQLRELQRYVDSDCDA